MPFGDQGGAICSSAANTSSSQSCCLLAVELALLEAIGFQLQNFLSLRDSVDGDQVYMSTTNDSQITLNTAHTSKHSSTYISIDLKSYLISLFIKLQAQSSITTTQLNQHDWWYQFHPSESLLWKAFFHREEYS